MKKDQIIAKDIRHILGWHSTEELTLVGLLLGLRVGDFDGLFVGFYQIDTHLGQGYAHVCAYSEIAILTFVGDLVGFWDGD